MQANEQTNARAGSAAGTLTATALIGFIGAIWQWRRALTADPFHYADSGTIASALLFSLALFVGLAAVIWLLTRLLRAHLLAPALLAASFLYLEFLAWFAGRQISVRTPTFVIGILLTSVAAVILAGVVRRGTGRRIFTRILMAAALVLVMATALPLAALLQGDQESDGHHATALSDRRPAPPGAPNLVLITIDTLRPDFLGAYGNPAVYTPHIDRYAREGTQVMRALSSIPITLPSHATIMTGTHPSTHGINNNGFPFTQAEETVLAGHLRNHGYRTGAFVAAYPLDGAFGLGVGFDVYDDETEDAAILSVYRFRKFLNETSTGAVLKRLGRRVMDHGVAERKGEVVWGAARVWLEEQDESPFFLWLHFYDPHAPYDPGPIGTRLYEDRTVLRGGMELDEIEVPPYARLKDAKDMKDYRGLYAGEVTRLDRVIGEVGAYFDQRGWSARTLFALTADHGEGLGSHDILTHAPRLHDEQLAVPLFLRGPGIARGELSRAPFRLVDLAPTLLARAALPPLPDAEGRVMTLDRGLRGSEETGAGEAGGDAAGDAARDFLHVAETPIDGGRRSLESDGWKLVHTLRTGDYELFDQVNDPGETTNRITDRQADDMFRSLGDLLESIPSALHGGSAPDFANLPESAREKLRGLGYLNDN